MFYFQVFKVNKKWLRWGFVILLALLTAFIIWIEQFGVASTSTVKSDQSAALIKGNPNHEKLALTFNISWGDEKVYPILEALDENNVQATFFVNGEWAEKNPDILEDISEQKHEIGMLGYRYKSYLEQEMDEVRQDLHKTREAFDKLGYGDLHLFRTPSGHFNEDIIGLAEQLEYQVIHWNVNPNDWENPGQQVIIDHVMKEAANGDIVLLHASDSAKQTGKALETILPGLKNKGFELITISELIHGTETETKPIE